MGIRFISELHKKVHNDELFSKDKHNGYAFGIYFSAYQASKLGFKSITCIEIGVAGGNGLVAMEKISSLVKDEFNIDIKLIGMDTGEGMPKPESYKDLPYTWREGQYVLEKDDLQDKLSNSKLVLGNVKSTVETLSEIIDFQKSPIGFISFDVDYYSSTRDALKILNYETIPRALLLFDDLVSTDIRYISEDIGQMAAIKEFNNSNDDKIRFIEHLGFNRPKNALWTRKIYCLHRYKQYNYNSYIDWNEDKQLKII